MKPSLKSWWAGRVGREELAQPRFNLACQVCSLTLNEDSFSGYLQLTTAISGSKVIALISLSRACSIRGRNLESNRTNLPCNQWVDSIWQRQYTTCNLYEKKRSCCSDFRKVYKLLRHAKCNFYCNF